MLTRYTLHYSDCKPYTCGFHGKHSYFLQFFSIDHYDNHDDGRYSIFDFFFSADAEIIEYFGADRFKISLLRNVVQFFTIIDNGDDAVF